jgi:hypothetical protein
MMRKLALTAAALLFLAAPGVAELCGKCRGRGYTTDVGKCAECRRGTSSGAFKLCRTCGRKLGQCERCRAAVTRGKRPSSRKRRKIGAARARALKRRLRDFNLKLKYYGEAGKPFHTLLLSVPAEGSTVSGLTLTVPVSEAQALRIVDHLVSMGFFTRAEYVDPRSRRKEWDPPRGWHYLLTVSNENLFLREDLGWKLPMLKRLDALRGVLDGAAATKMDLLLGRLKGLREKKKPVR